MKPHCSPVQPSRKKVNYPLPNKADITFHICIKQNQKSANQGKEKVLQKNHKLFYSALDRVWQSECTGSD